MGPKLYFVWGFELDPAEDLVGVGHVSCRSVRVWLRTRKPGRHGLELWPEGREDRAHRVTFDVPDDPTTDFTHSVEYPDELGGAPLAPGTRYGLRVVRTHDGHLLGHAAFETAPLEIDDAPEHFCVAVMSCNQPFDARGRAMEHAQRTLRVLPRAFTELGVRRVIMLGDQMYSDFPKALSLFDERYFPTVGPDGKSTITECSREQVRRLYQQRYRVFGNLPALKEIQARFPCYLVPDDHELFDNFGSAPEHRRGALEPVAEGALDAAFDFQGLRVRPRARERPPSMHTSFEYGPMAAFLMDLRSQRHADEERLYVYGDEQLQALRTYLEAQSARPILVLGVGVPLIHVPRRLATLGAMLLGDASDLADRWTYEKAIPSFERLCRVISEHQRAHPLQRVVLASGDIHIGMVARLAWQASGARSYQLVSSPVTHLESRVFRAVAGLLPRLANGHTFGEGELACRMDLLSGTAFHNRNPFSGLNVGVIEATRSARDWRLRLSLLSHAIRGDGYRLVFRSGPL